MVEEVALKMRSNASHVQNTSAQIILVWQLLSAGLLYALAVCSTLWLCIQLISITKTVAAQELQHSGIDF